MIQKSHFWYNKRQRNGILFLATILLAVMATYHFSNFSSETPETPSPYNATALTQFQQEIDSLKAIEIERRKPKIYPFNPSFLSDYKAQRFGMSLQEIDRLIAHQKAGKYINSAKHFQQVTKVNDSLLAVMQLHFKFPAWLVAKQQREAKKKAQINNVVQVVGSEAKKTSEAIKISTKDLNKATAQDLKTIYGIGEKLSARIVKYRAKIGGFLDKEQLNDVYGLEQEVIDRLFQRFAILSKPTITKINVNEATFKQVLHLPYIDYELTKKIFDYRDEVAEIQDLKELLTIDGFPKEKFKRIALYLSAE